MNDKGPCTLRSSTTLAHVKSSVLVSSVSGNRAGSSPAGATGPKSTTSARVPPAGCTTMKPMPPSPLFHGSRTDSAKAVATTASTAVPPAARISAPTWAATPFCDATMPRFVATAGLRTVQFWISASMLEDSACCIDDVRPSRLAPLAQDEGFLDSIRQRPSSRGARAAGLEDAPQLLKRSRDLDRIDPVAVKRVMPRELERLVVGCLVTPDRVFRGLVARLDRPVRSGALERAIRRVLGLGHQIERHVLGRDVVDRPVAGFLDPKRRGAVGDHLAAERHANVTAIGV